MTGIAMQSATETKIITISDLHIQGGNDPLYKRFLDFLNAQVAPGDILVLGGDLFDLLLGDKSNFKKQYSVFLDWVRSAGSKQIEIHYLEGNHDFYLKPLFRSAPWVKVHPRSHAFRLGEKRIWIEHGDLVDVQDYGYRVLRFILRSFFIKRLIDWVPAAIVQWIGNQMSKSSSHFTRRQIPPSKLERSRLLFRNAAIQRAQEGADLIIMGHCHLRDDFEFKVNERSARYINVGYPRTDGVGAVCRGQNVEWVNL